MSTQYFGYEHRNIRLGIQALVSKGAAYETSEYRHELVFYGELDTTIDGSNKHVSVRCVTNCGNPPTPPLMQVGRTYKAFTYDVDTKEKSNEMAVMYMGRATLGLVDYYHFNIVDAVIDGVDYACNKRIDVAINDVPSPAPTEGVGG